MDGGWATIFEIATVMSFCLDPTRKLTASRSHFRKDFRPHQKRICPRVTQRRYGCQRHFRRNISGQILARCTMALSNFEPTRRRRGAFSRRLNYLAPRNVAENNINAHYPDPHSTRRAPRCSAGLSTAFLSVQQSGFGETVGKPLGILFPLEGQPAQMFAERVFRIDLHELAPNATGLVHLAEMAESGHERGP